MKRTSALIALLAALFGLPLFAQAPKAEMSERAFRKALKKHRQKENEKFASASNSPLPEKARESFEGMDYFPADYGYYVEARFEEFAEKREVVVQTTRGSRKYLRYGKLTFQLKGAACSLTLYQNPSLARNPIYRNYLFLPFLDATNGETTYGGGRYLDFSIPESGAETVWIDFNRAYSPYCAYGKDGYDCPLVPEENRLPVAVEAGEKAWKKD